MNTHDQYRGRMCDGKKRFPEPSAAKRSLHTLRKYKGRHSEVLHWYHCPRCKGFHLGR